MAIKKNYNQKEGGFALLISLIVVGVVLSVGISILDLSIKQIKLSTNTRESEVSFHAANAGAECARYWRRTESDAMTVGANINPDCFGAGAVNTVPSQVPAGVITSPTPVTVGDGEVFQYDYQFEWGISAVRCTDISTLVASSTVGGSGVTTTHMTTLINGYPGDEHRYCEAGAQCTVVSVKGYNRPCATKNGHGSVEREVLLQF